MKKLVIANWKMNPETLEQARLLVLGLEHRMNSIHQHVDTVICAPTLFIPPLTHYAHLLKIGVQNVAWADTGAYTGEVSAGQLKPWEVEYVILGHSERRVYFGETDAVVNLKIQMALKHKLHPVVCLGGEKGAKKSDMPRLVAKQFISVTKDLTKDQIQKIIFVYEPIWAISTMKNSKPATGEHAAELIEHIQNLLAKKMSKERAAVMRILYGGTVNRYNVSEFARYPIIDGALVGGASLELENFWEVIKEFSRESVHKD
jgi:triosephosphate isomerase